MPLEPQLARARDERVALNLWTTAHAYEAGLRMALHQLNTGYCNHHAPQIGASIPRKDQPAGIVPDQKTGCRPGQAKHHDRQLPIPNLAAGSSPTIERSPSNPQLLFAAHRDEVPLPPSALVDDLPRRLDEILLRCLAKSPSERYATARELQHDLASLCPDAAEPKIRGGVTVLIIDDDRLTRRMVGDILKRNGVSVLEAENGYTGVEMALREKPDLVFLDLIMPVLDGREALRILKSNSSSAEIPVVVMTGLEDSREEAMLARDIGAAAFLNKPVQNDVL